MRSLAFMLADAGIALAAAARDGTEAIECLESERPDLLIADACLPLLDGASLVERALSTSLLPVRPRAMLTHYPEFPVSRLSEIEALGAAVVEYPVAAAGFASAIERLEQQTPVFPEAEHRRIELLLDDLGFPAHIGRDCLKYAVLAGAHNEFLMRHIGKKLVPFAAELCGISAAQAERAMRHAIAQAWRSDKFENQYRIFSDTVDAGRGQPTLSEMIFRLADILRLEG